VKFETTWAVALLAACGGLAGCGDDDTGGGDPAKSFRMATYNGGLAPGFVDYAAERAPAVYEAAGSLDVDLLCVQEFWSPEDRAGVKQAAAALPNSVFLEEMQETSDTIPCADAAAIDALITCAKASCEDPPTPNCIVTCNAEFSGLDSACAGCVQAQFGGTIDEINDGCSKPADLWVYGGSFGIGILTNGEILDQDTRILEANTTRRAVIYAKVDTPIGEVHAFCTHLTAGLSSVDHPKASEGGSWEAEQRAQIDVLRDMMDEKAGADGIAVLLGDLNTGPAVGDNVAEFEEHYNLIAEGFTNHYIEQRTECTFCNENTLVSGSADESPSEVIDHILIRNFSGSATMSRELDGIISVDTVDDGTIDTNISDHFGVMGTYTK